MKKKIEIVSKRSRIKRETDKTVGKRIRACRNLVGISQTELADRLGLTFQQVQKYEKGANRVSAGALYKIAEILGVPVGWFFEDGGDGERNPFSTEEIRLITLYRKMPDRAKEAVFGLFGGLK